MTTQEYQSFADNYSPKDFERISFQWEGGYGEDLKDTNFEFRIHLCEYLLPRLHQTKLELLKDLYLEVGNTSHYTFGCYINFYLLGQELLERGGAAYLTTYLQGASHTMDTALTSSKICLSKERAKELLAVFDARTKNPRDAQEAKLYNDYFRRRLEREANK